MKRLLIIGLIFLAGSFWLPASAGAQDTVGDEISVLVDGLPVVFDVSPVIHQGRTLVPFRATAEALHIEVSWDSASRTIDAAGPNSSVRLQIGSRTAYLNNTAVNLDVPPEICNGRTLIPLRFFSEACNYQVVWESSENTIRITSPSRDMTVVGFYALGSAQASSWTNLFGVPYPQTGSGNTDVVDVLALGWYSVDSNGSLLTRSMTGWARPDGWEDVLEAGENYNLKAEMVVHATDNGGTISSLLNDKAAVARAVYDIAGEAKVYGGVNLDFEGLGYRDEGAQLSAVRDSFTSFVRLLSSRLHEINKTLTVTLHAPNSSYRGYDYRSLGEIADSIIIMAYDYGPTPEPNELVVEAIEMARAGVPPQKLLLGVSAPSETPQSLATKIAIAKRYNLKGIALWRLGVISGEMWGTLREAGL